MSIIAYENECDIHHVVTSFLKSLAWKEGSLFRYSSIGLGCGGWKRHGLAGHLQSEVG